MVGTPVPMAAKNQRTVYLPEALVGQKQVILCHLIKEFRCDEVSEMELIIVPLFILFVFILFYFVYLSLPKI